MSESSANSAGDQWWKIASAIAVYAVIQISLIWEAPDSPWTWRLGGGAAVFAVAMQMNPALRHFHRAGWLFGIAGVLAVIPSVSLSLQLVDVGHLSYVATGSTLA